VLDLKEFDDYQLIPLDPTSGGHREKRHQRRHRGMSAFYDRLSFAFLHSAASTGFQDDSVRTLVGTSAKTPAQRILH
jgi:hypothetical protein